MKSDRNPTVQRYISTCRLMLSMNCTITINSKRQEHAQSVCICPRSNLGAPFAVNGWLTSLVSFQPKGHEDKRHFLCTWPRPEGQGSCTVLALGEENWGGESGDMSLYPLTHMVEIERTNQLGIFRENRRTTQIGWFHVGII